MPQFDKITFFNNVFWLFFFFSGFYLILLTTFLPKISSVLKARIKKLQKGTEDMLLFPKEQEALTDFFNFSLGKIIFISKISLSKCSEIFRFRRLTLPFSRIISSRFSVFFQYSSYNSYVFLEKTLHRQPVLGSEAKKETLIPKSIQKDYLPDVWPNFFSRKSLIAQW